MRVDEPWEVISDDATLDRLTNVSGLGAWTAVAVPSIDKVCLVLCAVWMNGTVWAFIDKKRPISSRRFVSAVRQFHSVLRDGGTTEVLGVRQKDVAPRWMEWLGAVKTNERVNGLEVWAWRN
jgi:hypothetical protein